MLCPAAEPSHPGHLALAAALRSIVAPVDLGVREPHIDDLSKWYHRGDLLAVLGMGVVEGPGVEVHGEVASVVLPHPHHGRPALLLLEPGAQLPPSQVGPRR